MVRTAFGGARSDRLHESQDRGPDVPKSRQLSNINLLFSLGHT